VLTTMLVCTLHYPSEGMTARSIVGAIAYACAVACALLSCFSGYAATNKVNQKLPAEEKFGLFFWEFTKHARLRREYRRLYPDGKLLRNAFMFSVAFFLLMLIAGWAYRMLPTQGLGPH
jgi:multidrug efflux pump subunit AcrB